MAYTKRQFINAAFDEIGLASYVFDLQPDALESALKKLDAMMAEWNGLGLRLSYPLPSNPDSSSLDENSTVPDFANSAVISNLAIRIAPSFGKIASDETKRTALSSLQVVYSRFSTPSERRFPNTLPVGSGNKPWVAGNDNYFPRPSNEVAVGNDSDLELY